jgi:hypothetical protein
MRLFLDGGLHKKREHPSLELHLNHTQWQFGLAKNPISGLQLLLFAPASECKQNGYEFAASAPHIGNFRKSAIVIPLLESSDFFGYSPENKLSEGNALECRQFFSFLL